MDGLTQAQQELYDWLVEYIKTTQHAPSIRQMMRDVERHDYGSGTQNYMDAEAAIDKMIAAAQQLYTKMST